MGILVLTQSGCPLFVVTMIPSHAVCVSLPTVGKDTAFHYRLQTCQFSREVCGTPSSHSTIFLLRETVTPPGTYTTGAHDHWPEHHHTACSGLIPAHPLALVKPCFGQIFCCIQCTLPGGGSAAILSINSVLRNNSPPGPKG